MVCLDPPGASSTRPDENGEQHRVRLSYFPSARSLRRALHSRPRRDDADPAHGRDARVPRRTRRRAGDRTDHRPSTTSAPPLRTTSRDGRRRIAPAATTQQEAGLPRRPHARTGKNTGRPKPCPRNDTGRPARLRPGLRPQADTGGPVARAHKHSFTGPWAGPEPHRSVTGKRDDLLDRQRDARLTTRRGREAHPPSSPVLPPIPDSARPLRGRGEHDRVTLDRQFSSSSSSSSGPSTGGAVTPPPLCAPAGTPHPLRPAACKCCGATASASRLHAEPHPRSHRP